MASHLAEVSHRWGGQSRSRLGGLGLLLGLSLAGLAACKSGPEPVSPDERAGSKPALDDTCTCTAMGDYELEQTITVLSELGAPLSPRCVCLIPGGKLKLVNRCPSEVNVSITGSAASAPFAPQGVGADHTHEFKFPDCGTYELKVEGCGSTTKDSKTGTVEVGTDPKP